MRGKIIAHDFRQFEAIFSFLVWVREELRSQFCTSFGSLKSSDHLNRKNTVFSQVLLPF